MNHDNEASAPPLQTISLFDQLRTQQVDLAAKRRDVDGDLDKSPEPAPVEAVSTGELASASDPEPAAEPFESGSTMPPEAKRALVSLLRQGVILASQKARLYEVICRYQSEIRRHLSEVYLNLVLDEKSGVVFVAGEGDAYAQSQAQDATTDNPSGDDDADEDAVSLITRRPLSLFDTLLLLVLRKHYQERESSGEQRVVIDAERVESNLAPFLPLTNSSKSDRKKLNAALQKMVEKRILSSVRGSDDRYEITPLIRYVVNAQFLESMLTEYNRLAQEAGLTDDSAPSRRQQTQDEYP